MNVEFHFSLDTLMAVNKLLNEVYKMPIPQDKLENVYRSIGMDLADKFDKKCKAQIRKANLFDNKKKKMSLKFHEAWALEAIINDLMKNIISNDYQQSLLRNLTQTINQKLA